MSTICYYTLQNAEHDIWTGTDWGNEYRMTARSWRTVSGARKAADKLNSPEGVFIIGHDNLGRPVSEEWT